MDLAAHLVPGVLAARAVAIDAQNARGGKRARQRAFDALRALPQRQQILVAALRTRGRNAFLMAAMVAAQALVLEMQHELGRAAMAVRGPAATPANQHRRITAAVDENQALLAAFYGRIDRPQQFLRQAVDQRRVGACRYIRCRAGIALTRWVSSSNR